MRPKYRVMREVPVFKFPTSFSEKVGTLLVDDVMRHLSLRAFWLR